MTQTTNKAYDAEAGQMVFTMGLPAAGKSTWVAANLPQANVIDPDAVKESHPDYDPKNPAALHAWSQAETEKAFNAALAQMDSRPVVVDGTGTNAEKMARRMTQAKAAGYTVRLVYVTCSLATSLERNAARERVVPEAIVRSKALDIATSYEIVSCYADDVTTVDNN